jgi:hypothetical protein
LLFSPNALSIFDPLSLGNPFEKRGSQNIKRTCDPKSECLKAKAIQSFLDDIKYFAFKLKIMKKIKIIALMALSVSFSAPSISFYDPMAGVATHYYYDYKLFRRAELRSIRERREPLLKNMALCGNRGLGGHEDVQNLIKRRDACQEVVTMIDEWGPRRFDCEFNFCYEHRMAESIPRIRENANSLHACIKQRLEAGTGGRTCDREIIPRSEKRIEQWSREM